MKMLQVIIGLNLLKGNKKRKLHKAQAPTTVESLEVDAYAVDIKRVENPFVKDDEDSDDDVFCHLPELKFHSTKSVSHAKMVHNAKEKKRFFKQKSIPVVQMMSVATDAYNVQCLEIYNANKTEVFTTWKRPQLPPL
ncbi:uncharacterized protein [Dysidea avara]|uniref:uncharacterized protein isoform X2 n=1 Tax=Dysidea avara TaxID=196820 RepID=UPI0033194EED